MKCWVTLCQVRLSPTWCVLREYAHVLQVDAIREYWSFCGEIEDLDVMRFPDTGRFKGIAFITYSTVSPPTYTHLTQALRCNCTDGLPLYSDSGGSP